MEHSKRAYEKHRHNERYDNNNDDVAVAGPYLPLGPGGARAPPPIGLAPPPKFWKIKKYEYL